MQTAHEVTLKDALETIRAHTYASRGGHSVCALSTVRLGSAMVPAARAYWRLTVGPIPNTHRLVKLCEEKDCIAIECHTTEPLAKPKAQKTHCHACGRAFGDLASAKPGVSSNG